MQHHLIAFLFIKYRLGIINFCSLLLLILCIFIFDQLLLDYLKGILSYFLNFVYFGIKITRNFVISNVYLHFLRPCGNVMYPTLLFVSILDKETKCGDFGGEYGASAAHICAY